MKSPKLKVLRGNYTQLHLSGFGYGDSALESGISQVGARLRFEPVVLDGATTIQ